MNRVQTSIDGKKRKSGRIGRRVGLVVAVMQVISIILAVVICVYMFRSLITKMQTDRCTNGTNMLEHELSRVSEDDDMNEILDELKSRMRCEFTIFEGDTRAYSTVTQNGERVVGTKLPSELSEIVLKQGKSYVGEATILGTSYLCSYVPTKGENGEIDGLIFAGMSTAEAKAETQHVVIIVSVVSLSTIAVCLIFLAVFIKKRVSSPLGRITKVAERMEKGDLGIADGKAIRVDVRSNDEIGFLGQIFEDTIRRLKSYIGEISEVLGAIANGNLTQSARLEYLGDFESIRESLDSIQREMNNTMGQIAASAGQVADGSSQVSSSAQSLAQGATEQASAVQEISATISEISESAKRTSAAAAEAGGFVNQAGAQLGISMDYVKKLNVAMENISGSSKEISTIIATIENIAFQINILALNAAVEAARAGEAGKGFAVVADEVRNLASKSDEAAKATKELIESSIIAVTDGTEVVNSVTEALDKTSESAGHVTAKMSTVVEAVEKQTTAIAQVTEGISQISAVVQNNSATSEQCAAASEELSSQASLLKRLMSSFRLSR
ncbi:MAG: HAMP domain-containing protein [Eubacterium sp.]|nr:HAMP domain-containing protein [Eubacterium sp.]